MIITVQDVEFANLDTNTSLLVRVTDPAPYLVDVTVTTTLLM